MKHHRTSALIVLAGLAASGLGACKGRDSAAVDSAGGRVDTTTPAASMRRTDSANAVATRRDSSNATARSGWTDASILGFVSVANNDEIRVGQLAEKKATNSKLKAFARELVADHRAMIAETKSMGSKVSAAADTTADAARDLLDHGRDELKDLTDKAAGADWDKDFINKMIDDHQKVLDKLQDASKNTTNADLRAGLEKATGKVQQHLTKAQDLKTNVLKD
jgi:putative membrane protein